MCVFLLVYTYSRVIYYIYERVIARGSKRQQAKHSRSKNRSLPALLLYTLPYSPSTLLLPCPIPSFYKPCSSPAPTLPLPCSYPAPYSLPINPAPTLLLPCSSRARTTRLPCSPCSFPVPRRDTSPQASSLTSTLAMPLANAHLFFSSSIPV